MGVDGASEVEVDEVNEKDGDVSESAAAGVFGMAMRHASTSADDDDEEKANGDDNEKDDADTDGDEAEDDDADDEDSGDNGGTGTDTATEGTAAEGTGAEDTGAGACVDSVVIVCERGRPAGSVDIHSSASCSTTMAEVAAESEAEAAAPAAADEENAKAVGEAADLESDDDSAIDVWKGEKAERARMRLL